MYKNEIKKELQAIYNSNKNIDSELVNIKIAIHNLEKLTKDIIIFRVNSSLFDSKHKNNKVGIGLFISINTLI